MERSFMPQEKRKQLEGEDAKLGYVHQRRDSVWKGEQDNVYT